MGSRTEEEDAAVEITERKLLEYKPWLESLKLEFTVHALRRVESEHEYESELTIDFLSNGELVDVIEFHIFRGGKLAASAEALAEWLDETITDVLRRAKDGPSTLH